MKKNITTTNKNSKLALTKSKNLMNIADKILAKKTPKNLVEDDSWMQRLWDWADENDIGDFKKNYYHDGSYSVKGFPRNKKDLLALDRLNLSFEKISNLPKEIGNLVNLTELTLNYNNLSELPKEIGNLVNLTELSVGNGNRNTNIKIPKEIGNLVNLTKLRLGQKAISVIPKEIGNLVNLTELSFTKTTIKLVPKEIGNLVNLTKLDLRWTQLPIALSKEVLELQKCGCEILTNLEFYR